MPTYEYECTSCGRHIEVFQRITEDPLTTCEACGGQLRKVFHPAGIVFKGSGFYATDSRKSSGSTPSKKEEGSGSGSRSDSGSSSSSSSDGGSSTKTDAASTSSSTSTSKDGS